MGNRGPKPLPANVHSMRGNPSKKPISELNGDLRPPVEIPKCPGYLQPIAKAFWRYITPLLFQLGLIAKIDRTSLELLSEAYAWYYWHNECLCKDIKIAGEKRTVWEADLANAGRPWSGGDGFQVPTPNGSFTYNPHWVARRGYVSEIDNLLKNFGMNPAARARVTPSDNYPYLPGMAPTADNMGTAASRISSLADFANKHV